MKTATYIGALIGSSIVMFVITAGGEYGKRASAERKLEAAMEQVEDLDQLAGEMALDIERLRTPFATEMEQRQLLEERQQIPVYSVPVYTVPVYNAEGGYIESCGERAGLVGDDC